MVSNASPTRETKTSNFHKSRVIVAGLTLALTASTIGFVAPAAQAAVPSTVTLTFDDANLDQLGAATFINNLGMKGTFFTPSGYIGSPNYMSVSQVQALQAAGNEIGGHSVTHPDLTTMNVDEVTRQVCTDRVNLANMGLDIQNFAYPFASENAAVESIVQQCGYNSARGLGDVRSKSAESATFPFFETIPPANAYVTGAPDQVDNTWTLLDLQNLVTNANANGGGWVQYTFHHIGDGIDPGSGVADPLTVSTALFQEFSTWLAGQVTAGTVVVKTVKGVIGGTTKPLLAGPAAPAATTLGNLIQNPSMETPGPNDSPYPNCWAPGSYGANTPVYTAVSPGHGGTATAARQIGLSNYVSGDAKFLQQMDLGQCAPSATPGKTYLAKAWYKASGLTQFEAYYRTGLGNWVYWTASPMFAASSTEWAQASWISEPVPAGATAISIGLNILANGTLITDDYELYDTATVRSFTDVPATANFYKEVSWASNNLITTGYLDGTFRPLQNIDRNAMAAFMYRLAGSPAYTPPAVSHFKDVPPTGPFYKEVNWLYDQGITTGYADGTFRPFDSVNRDAVAAFLYRMNGKPAVPANAPTFVDVRTTTPFYNEIRWLAATGITTGYPGNLYKPIQPIARDAMAAFVYRYNQNFPKG
ncbi:S-layer homology domain-containing protein [Arthrobacter sp. TWP1-1]|uniref:S-layer homology domain-containing protein n=1 Tax=Arthrobacter sp. TWP1-1 TaxID=2804568 RepID=UPI003CF0C9BA